MSLMVRPNNLLRPTKIGFLITLYVMELQFGCHPDFVFHRPGVRNKPAGYSPSS